MLEMIKIYSNGRTDINVQNNSPVILVSNEKVVLGILETRPNVQIVDVFYMFLSDIKEISNSHSLKKGIYKPSETILNKFYSKYNYFKEIPYDTKIQTGRTILISEEGMVFFGKYNLENGIPTIKPPVNKEIFDLFLYKSLEALYPLKIEEHRQYMFECPDCLISMFEW